MSLFRSLFGRGKREVPCCDICNDSLESGASYLLTTAQVVTSEAHWRNVLGVFLAPTSFKSEADRALEVQQAVSEAASSDTPWMICGNCLPRYAVDPEAAMNAAQEWRRTGTPKNGLRLCRIEGTRSNIVVKVVDASGYQAAIAAATRACESP